MTRQILRQHWPQIRADCRAYWGKLTDLDLDRISGEFEAFVQALRERYGFSALKAEDELDQFLFCYGDDPRSIDNSALAEART